MSFGADPRWKQEQEEIYWHAKGLGIADTPHPWGADRKEGTEDDLTKGQWKSFTDRLNARKAEATAGGTQDFVLGSTDEQNRRSSDWYRTQEGRDYAESLGLPGGFGINTAFQDGGAAAAAAAPLVTGGGVPGSSLYPMGLVDYEAPTAMPGIPLEYQPWLQPDHIPDSLWNYQPPTLQEWSLDPRMGWADTPVSEFAPKESPPTVRSEVNDGNQGDPLDTLLSPLNPHAGLADQGIVMSDEAKTNMANATQAAIALSNAIADQEAMEIASQGVFDPGTGIQPGP